MKFSLGLLLLMFSTLVNAQSGIIKGEISNVASNEKIPFASIRLIEQNIGVESDIEGNYALENLMPGTYNIEVVAFGFEKLVKYDVEVTNAKPTFLNLELSGSSDVLDSLVVSASLFNKSAESPVSLRTMQAAEIMRFPGANRDISKVVSALPGVQQSSSFRNDIIIRGGAPNENRFYLDGIEVPNINHFATQGSSGGPVGLLNVNFIDEVEFYSGAFPANRGNALSSVFEFKQRDGNAEKLAGTFTVGSSDVGLTLDGPMGEKTTFIFSARRSYLQFLFQALKLPFLPTYNDAQFKLKHKFNDKNELTFIGLGAIDEFALNTGVNDDVTDSSTLERNQYSLDNIPVNNQWNYTFGASFKHFKENGFVTIVASRNHLNNEAFKYFKNDDSDEDNLLYKYASQEIENKFRLEEKIINNGWRINYGIAFENVTYKNNTFNKVFTSQGPFTVDYKSSLSFNKYALFGQIGKKLMADKLTLSAGFRSDFNDYSKEMSSPLDQFSPRFSLSYMFTEKFGVNANVGKYYQLPAYTVLGYRDSNDELVNKTNKVSYMNNLHYVLGIEYNTEKNAKFTVEGFYKQYDNYPFLLADSISLANLGADFGVIGAEPVESISQGRSYGVEFLAQQKLFKGFYGIVAYTFVTSEFKDKNGDFKPSAWDAKHMVSLTGGKKFKKNWDLGVRWLFSGGAPYSPYDEASSVLIPAWNVRGTGLLDYDRLNESRLKPFHQLDVRVDKRWYFKKWTLNLYLDIQNLYGFKSEQPSILNVKRDAAGNAIEDPLNPGSYQPYYIENVSGTVLPSIGIVIEF